MSAHQITLESVSGVYKTPLACAEGKALMRVLTIDPQSWHMTFVVAIGRWECATDDLAEAIELYNKGVVG